MHGRVVSVPQERRHPAGALSRPNPQSDEEVPVRSSLNRSSRPARFLPALIAFGLVLAGIPAGAQAPPKYHDHAGLTKALQALAGAAGPTARLESIGKTRNGRDLWVLEIANPGGVPADKRPALLIAAGFEGDYLAGGEIALAVAEYLVKNAASDPEVKSRLDGSTIYIMPRVNPDGAEGFFAPLKTGLRTNASPFDDDNDGRVDEDGPEDLNGDGFITVMRVKAAGGEYVIDRDEPRLMKRADPKKGETGAYKLFTEGTDNDGDGFINEDPPGGTDIGRNFAHEYPYYKPDAGPHMISEAESRAVMDWVVAHRNVAAILTFGESDNLIVPPTSAGRLGPARELDLVRFAEAAAAGARTSGFIQTGGGMGRGGRFGGGGFSFEMMAGPGGRQSQRQAQGASSPRMMMPDRKPATTVASADYDYFKGVSDKYIELTGIRQPLFVREPQGAFFQYGYFQFGVPSFSTPGFGLTTVEPSPGQRRMGTMPPGAAESGPPGQGGQAGRQASGAGVTQTIVVGGGQEMMQMMQGGGGGPIPLRPGPGGRFRRGRAADDARHRPPDPPVDGRREDRRLRRLGQGEASRIRRGRDRRVQALCGHEPTGGEARRSRGPACEVRPPSGLALPPGECGLARGRQPRRRHLPDQGGGREHGFLADLSRPGADGPVGQADHGPARRRAGRGPLGQRQDKLPAGARRLGQPGQIRMAHQGQDRRGRRAPGAIGKGRNGDRPGHPEGKVRTTMRTRKILSFILALAAGLVLTASFAPAQKASDPAFKVKLDFNRWHDTNELYADMKRLQAAFPKFLKLESIGKSHDGRDLMLMTVNNPATGPESGKAGMYIEANVHGNEIQGGEVCLYTIWYLMENYGRIEDVTRLVDERVFYIIPTVNPDGRQYFMEGPGGNARSGHVPVDDDNDGLFDEDPPEDINGNGIVEQIRKRVPGEGNYRISRTNPDVLEPVPFGETGDYILLGQEGVDNDGDGMVNEDGPGSYDPNRNWPSDWQPDYIQSGAMDYPFQLPEARAVADFLKAHPNISGVQSYHNNGGMILRGPGAESVGEYPMGDVRFYDELGQNGERILPFYRYIVLWSGLYTVHGGFIDYTNDGLGIPSFSNELWNGDQYFTSPALQEQQADPSSPIAPAVSRYYFDRYLEFGDEFVEWKAFDHPQFGQVEMGGIWKKFQGRVPPRFMNEELCHRNMAFSLYQAGEMPLIRMGETSVEKIGGDVYRVFVDITNPKVAPTIMARAAQNFTVRPDLLLVDGKRRRGHRGQLHRQQGRLQGQPVRDAARRPEGLEADHHPQRAPGQDDPDGGPPGQGFRRGDGDL